MHCYEKVKRDYGNHVSQTIDKPIMFFEFWDLSDCVLSLLAILIFGIIFYSWWGMIGFLSISLVISPLIKRNNNRGIFIHWFYKNFGVELPAMINPKGTNKFSD